MAPNQSHRDSAPIGLPPAFQASNLQSGHMESLPSSLWSSPTPLPALESLQVQVTEADPRCNKLWTDFAFGIGLVFLYVHSYQPKLALHSLKHKKYHQQQKHFTLSYRYMKKMILLQVSPGWGFTQRTFCRLYQCVGQYNSRIYGIDPNPKVIPRVRI